MTSVAFNTHTNIKRLIEKGISEPQAEAFVTMMLEAQQSDISHLSTKEELASFKSELKGDMNLFRSEFKSEIRELEARMGARLSETKSEIIKWHFGSFVAIIGLLTAILFKLH